MVAALVLETSSSEWEFESPRPHQLSPSYHERLKYVFRYGNFIPGTAFRWHSHFDGNPSPVFQSNAYRVLCDHCHWPDILANLGRWIVRASLVIIAANPSIYRCIRLYWHPMVIL